MSRLCRKVSRKDPSAIETKNTKEEIVAKKEPGDLLPDWLKPKSVVRLASPAAFIEESLKRS
ncbi:MAG: hypothetical protein D6679_12750, partial [Candidatus Hydrogenedentota bacterium]